MHVRHDNVTVNGCSFFYREAGYELSTPQGTVLLLHGMKFSSANWEEISTLSKIAEWNYRAVAIDLPGFGKSSEADSQQNKAVILKNLCDALQIKKPIVISPSMSGQYSLPFLHTLTEHIEAYIPIVPVSTENYTTEQYKALHVPTFIVYGENDKVPFAESAVKFLKLIPGSKEMKIKDAGHACYLDQPEIWHGYLHDILETLSRQ